MVFSNIHVIYHYNQKKFCLFIHKEKKLAMQKRKRES